MVTCAVADDSLRQRSCPAEKRRPRHGCSASFCLLPQTPVKMLNQYSPEFCSFFGPTVFETPVQFTQNMPSF